MKNMSMTNPSDATIQDAPALAEGSVLGWNLAFSASTCAASYALVSPRFALAVALGAVLELMNFRSLWRSCERVFFAGRQGVNGAGMAVGAFGLRFLLLAGVLFFAIQAGMHPVGLVVGLSLIMPAAVIAAWRVRPAIDPNARALPDDDPAWNAWNPWTAREAEPADPEDDDEVGDFVVFHPNPEEPSDPEVRS